MTKEWLVSAFLFLLTLVTTTLTGAAYAGYDYSDWQKGLVFSIPLLLILFTHEMGHYLAAKKHKIKVSPPYFIPLPPSFGIGTMGAVIKIKEKIASRNALMDVGAAGPLAGLFVAIPVLIYGIYLSPVSNIPQNFQGFTEGNSVLYLSLKYLIHGMILPSGNKDIMMHPTAFAGWIGLLVTMINLIPIGQLDGGHVFYAWFGDKYSKYSKLVHIFLPVLGILVTVYVTAENYFYKNLNFIVSNGFTAPQITDSFLDGISAAMPWFMWSLILIVLKYLSGGISHPPVGDDPLTSGRKVLAWIIAVVFALIFMPIPMRMS